MSTRRMYSKLRSKFAALISPLYCWCVCTGVKEAECDERNHQTEVGREVPSCQGHPRSEVIPPTTGSTAEAEHPAPGPEASGINGTLPLIVANEEQSNGNKPAPCSETVEGSLQACNCPPAPVATVAEPNTPVQISPVASRGLSQISLESQDSQAEPATNADTSGTTCEPAAQPAQSPTISSNDSSISSTTSCSSCPVSTGNLSYGITTAINARQYQEDRATAAVFHNSEHGREFSRVAVAAVFDGHGGSEASERLQQQFAPTLLQQLQLGASPQQAIAASTQVVEAQLMSSKCMAGSTLTAVVVVDDYLVVAQVGDSRALLCRAEGKPVQLTAAHKPSDDSERARIMVADPAAEITSDGYCYGMAVSRGLGSHHIKSDTSMPAFTAAVDIIVHQLTSEDDFIFLGSDGVFDSMQNQEVATVARRTLATAHGDCSAAAQAVVDRAISMGSTDNATAVVMMLHDRKVVLAKSNSRLFRNRQ